MNGFFDNGTANIGGEDVAFTKRQIRGNFTMYIPQSFFEDKAIVANYSYFFGKEKSPLSIAIKFSSISAIADRQRMIDTYFKHAPQENITKIEVGDETIQYHESVASSEVLGIYTLRFSVGVKGGIFFGCFNCAESYKDEWQPIIIEMLLNIERAES